MTSKNLRRNVLSSGLNQKERAPTTSLFTLEVSYMWPKQARKPEGLFRLDTVSLAFLYSAHPAKHFAKDY
jgi:hypothetical protein